MARVIEGEHSIKCPLEWCYGEGTVIGGKEVCSYCGLDISTHKRSTMVDNLSRYGFKKVKLYEKPNWFRKLFKLKTKCLGHEFVYGDVIKAHWSNDNSSNLLIDIFGEIHNFNYQYNYEWFAEHLDEIITDDIKREIKLID